MRVILLTFAYVCLFKLYNTCSQPIAPRGGQLRGNDTGLVWPAG